METNIKESNEQQPPFSGPLSERSLNCSASSQSFQCPECRKTFAKSYNLKRHVKDLHAANPDLLNVLKSKKKTMAYECDSCERKFNALKNFNYHRNSEHKPQEMQPKIHTCPLCKVNFGKHIILNHFIADHDVHMTNTEMTFSSFQNFMIWKSTIENSTKSKFIKYGNNSAATKGCIKHYYFHCHRSGNFVSESKGIRYLKLLGSKKINAYCPATIKVAESDGGECLVTFQSTHLGHDNELGHLYLTNDERNSLASKIASKVPFDDILDEIRDSVTDSGLERLHLLTKHDLHNIEKSFNLSAQSVRHKNDSISVHMWVQEMQDSQSPSVLFYKTQGKTTTEHPFLNTDDFVLMIMTEAQGDVLKKFGLHYICIDGTHGINSYGFELITILVIDDMHQGFPCAFLISNRSDYAVLSLFFFQIKQKIGTLNTKVFMSDMAEAFYNAWSSQMGPAESRLFCAWHVDRAWRTNLKKINGGEKQAEVYQLLRSLLQERDKNTFNVLLEAVLKHLSEDPDTVDFGNYFLKYYTQNTLSWAYCHRLHCGLNTNMHIERMHRTLKYIYLHGKNVKRLDKAIHAIMRFVKDKMFDTLIVSYKGKLTSKIRDLRSRHKTSSTMTSEIIENESGWVICSQNKDELYQIEDVNSKCNCQLKCTDCNACIHRYICSCMDSSIKWNMCKHIHYLCQFQKKYSTLPKNITSVSEEPSQVGDENELIINELTCKKSHPLTQENRRADLQNKYSHLISSLSTPEQFELMEKTYKSLLPSMNAIGNLDSNKTNFASLHGNVPANKNISPQRTFHLKKKRKLTKKTTQPSSQQAQNLALTLIMSHKEDISKNMQN